MKRSLEKALAGEYRFLSGLIQGYTCDVACGMANIWADNIKGEIFHTLPLPYEDNTEFRHYLKTKYQLLINKLREIGGTYSDANLTQSLTIYSGIRNRVRELYQLRMTRRLPLNAAERCP